MRPSRLRNPRPLAARRALTALVGVGLLVAACSGLPAAEEAESCEDLVAVGVAWVERTADVLVGQPLEVVTGEAEAPEELAELQVLGAGIDARAAELGCATDDLNQAIAAGVADLESDDPVVSLFLRIVQSNPGAEEP